MSDGVYIVRTTLRPAPPSPSPRREEETRMDERITNLEKEVAELKRQLDERLESTEKICSYFKIDADGKLVWKRMVD